MKLPALLFAFALIISSCGGTQPIAGTAPAPDTRTDNQPAITQSLFTDKDATISEENIKKILDGNYKLPQQLRVAILKLESTQPKRYYWNYWNYWTDEQYLKNEQSYLDLFTEKFRQSSRVVKIANIPELLVPRPSSFTRIREAALRMQADVVVVYAINSDMYSKYKLFKKDDIKAYATSQLIVLDVRTGLIPFSAISTKDYLSQKQAEELDMSEARSRIQHEAVLLTISEIGEKITEFLKS